MRTWGGRVSATEGTGPRELRWGGGAESGLIPTSGEPGVFGGAQVVTQAL